VSWKVIVLITSSVVVCIGAAADTNDPAKDRAEHLRRFARDIPARSGGPDILIWTQGGKTDTNLLISMGFGHHQQLCCGGASSSESGASSFGGAVEEMPHG
jgi:hypothetical protein